MAFRFRPNLPLPRKTCSYFLIVFAAAIFLAGCAKNGEVDDPQLKPIQEMLNTNLPPGATEGAVTQFLSARGYPLEPHHKPGTLVAIIRHIDTDRLQPVTARVTFYFDANGKLNATEIVRTYNRQVSQ
jgi:PBP1b-binding outer membrane lipoprotein LpoB